MRLNTPIVRCKAIVPPPAILLALSLFAASFLTVPRLRADQSQQDTASLLTTGQWTLQGVNRTFNPDGTYSSSNSTKGTWKIDGNALEITLGRMVLRYNLPLDPNGSTGVSQGGKERTLARVSAGNDLAEHSRAIPVRARRKPLNPSTRSRPPPASSRPTMTAWSSSLAPRGLAADLSPRSARGISW